MLVKCFLGMHTLDCAFWDKEMSSNSTRHFGSHAAGHESDGVRRLKPSSRRLFGPGSRELAEDGEVYIQCKGQGDQHIEGDIDPMGLEPRQVSLIDA